MSYPSPYLKTKFKMNYATGECKLVKEENNDLVTYLTEVKASIVHFQETYGDNEFSNGQVFMIDRILNKIKEDENSSKLNG